MKRSQRSFLLTRVSAYIILTYRFIIVLLRSISTSQHGVRTETIKLAFEEGTLECSRYKTNPRSHFSSRLRAVCRDRSSRRKSSQQRRSHFRFSGNYAERSRPRSRLISAACHYRASGHLFVRLIESFIRTS